MIKNGRVLITGGAGFIGSQLAKLLIDENEIIIVDNFRRNALEKQVKEDPRLKDIPIHNTDVTDFEAVSKVINDVNPTHVVHAAAIAGINTVSVHPATTLEINMLGTLNVLKSCLKLSNLQRVVTFSTSEIFGSKAFNSDEHSEAIIGPVGEPRWTYAVSKLASEHLSYAYFKQYEVPTVSLRPFNVYGPGQVGEGALSMFVKNAIQNKPITIHGSGSQIRAWCYVDDMVNGVLCALANDNANGKAFNIGNALTSCTIYSLARTIVRVINSKSEIEFVKKEHADIELRIPDTDYPEREIGFKAAIDLEEGIPQTADFYRRHM